MDEDTVRFGSLEEWAREIKVPVQALQERVRHIPAIRARAADGKPIEFYAEEDIRRVCRELLPELKPARTR